MPISLASNSSIGHPGYVSGRYYQGLELVNADVSTASGLTTTSITYVPFPIHSLVQISRIAIYASGTSGNARFGIYSNQNGLPKDLLIDGGLITITSSGAKEAIISLTLDKGWYWLGGITSQAPSLYCAASFLGMNHLLGQASPTSLSVSNSLRNSGSYSSLPSVAPTDNLSLITGNTQPLFWFKVA